MSDRPALPANLSVRTDGNEIVVEPGPVYGCIGFTLTLSREGAKTLGHALISAATRLLPATTNAKEKDVK